MGGDDDRCVLAVVGNDGVQDVVPGRRVHAADGLIQQVETGVAAHGQHQLNLLLVALGKGLEPGIGGDVQPGQHLIGLVGVKADVSLGLTGRAVKIPEHLHQLLHPHPVGQPVGVRQVGNKGLGVRAGGHAGYLDAAGRGLQQAVGQLDEGGLAAAVGAQQAHDAAKIHMQIHAVQRGLVFVVALGQCFTGQNLTHCASSLVGSSCSSRAAARAGL